MYVCRQLAGPGCAPPPPPSNIDLELNYLSTKLLEEAQAMREKSNPTAEKGGTRTALPLPASGRACLPPPPPMNHSTRDGLARRLTEWLWL